MWRPQCAIFAFLLSLNAGAQTPQVCLGGPASSNKLICLIPGVYGVNGLQLTSANQQHQGHFADSFVSTTSTPLSSAIGTQSSLLPLASPSSGLTFTWDPVAKAFAPSTDSLGPVLSERSETIGKHRIYLGFSYQFFDFDSLDGVSLKDIPVVFTHQDDAKDSVTQGATGCSVSAPQNGTSSLQSCAYVRDVIKTRDRIDLKIHQFTAFATFGLTNNIDVSVAIPIETVRMGVLSTATIVDNSGSGDHEFQCSPSPCLTESFPTSPSAHGASGIGDLSLRIKGTPWKGERMAVAVGADIRVPTGDELNFLGAGAIGLRPFVIWSYRSRISPHVLLGYQSNESSVLAGDISTGRKARLPSAVTYSGGVDIWITKRLTGAFDLVGQEVHHARRVAASTFTELGACLDPYPDCVSTHLAEPNRDRDTSQSIGSYNATNAAIGIKARLVGRFLLSANVSLKLNDGGLRAKAVPLVAASYTF